MKNVLLEKKGTRCKQHHPFFVKLVIRHGQVSGDPDLVLHPPQLTDPPLVLGLPLL